MSQLLIGVFYFFFTFMKKTLFVAMLMACTVGLANEVTQELTPTDASGSWGALVNPTVFVLNQDVDLHPANGSTQMTAPLFSSICKLSFVGQDRDADSRPSLTMKDYLADSSKSVYLMLSDAASYRDSEDGNKSGISFSYLKNLEISGNEGFADLLRVHSNDPDGSEGISFSHIGRLAFVNNTNKSAGGRLIYANPKKMGEETYRDAIVSFKDIGEVVFDGNNAMAVHSSSGIAFEGIGKLEFKNSAHSDSSFKYGGAIHVYAPTDALDPSAPLTYFSLQNCGDVLFQNNKASYGGAICLQASAQQHNHRFLLSADNGNIVFKGNTMSVTSVLGPSFATGGLKGKLGKECLSSIFLFKFAQKSPSYAGRLSFRAQEGREISFYDPIRSTCTTCQGKHDDYTPTYFNGESLEEGRLYGGTIRFSANYVRDYITMTEAEKNGGEDGQTNYDRRVAISSKSGFGMQGHLFGGRLIVEDGAILGRTYSSAWVEGEEPTRTSFDHHQGILEMSRQGAINVCNAVFHGKDAVLRTEKDCSIVAGDTHKEGRHEGFVDMSQGFSFDFPHFLEDVTKTESMSGLKLDTPLLKLGGKIWVYDNKGTYEQSVWKSKHRFLVLDTRNVAATEGALVEENGGIASTVADSHRVEDPYAYKGTWTIEWLDSDQNGVEDELYAIWTPDSAGTGGDIVIDPVKRGSLAENTLWSSATNLHTMGNAAMKQLGMSRLFNDGRYRKEKVYDEKCGLVETHTSYTAAPRFNAWVQGLGDFSSHQTQGDVAGYRYEGGGVAAGMDIRLGRHLGYLGIGIGQIWGRNTARGVQEFTRQESTMGTLYWGKGVRLRGRRSLVMRGALSYGQTENRMTSWFDDGLGAHGRFDNETLYGQLECIYRMQVRENLSVNVFAGVEYTNGEREAFSESGSYARDFESSRLENLSIPVGVEIEHEGALGGRPWLNTWRLSYVGDVHRKQPEAGVYGRYSDAEWTAYSVNPSRHGIRCGWESTLQLNEKWSLNAEYSIEGRENALYQQVRAGATYQF